jgi:hypothetical protein
MSDKYFALNILESDPNKLLEWLTDWGTQKMVRHSFDNGYQAFHKDTSGCILVHSNLKLCYRLWFDTDNQLKELGINLPPDTE